MERGTAELETLKKVRSTEEYISWDVCVCVLDSLVPSLHSPAFFFAGDWRLGMRLCIRCYTGVGMN